jgi:hypothetical protein
LAGWLAVRLGAVVVSWRVLSGRGCAAGLVFVGGVVIGAPAAGAFAPGVFVAGVAAGAGMLLAGVT